MGSLKGTGTSRITRRATFSRAKTHRGPSDRRTGEQHRDGCAPPLGGSKSTITPRSGSGRPTRPRTALNGPIESSPHRTPRPNQEPLRTARPDQEPANHAYEKSAAPTGFSLLPGKTSGRRPTAFTRNDVRRRCVAERTTATCSPGIEMPAGKGHRLTRPTRRNRRSGRRRRQGETPGHPPSAGGGGPHPAAGAMAWGHGRTRPMPRRSTVGARRLKPLLHVRHLQDLQARGPAPDRRHAATAHVRTGASRSG